MCRHVPSPPKLIQGHLGLPTPSISCLVSLVSANRNGGAIPPRANHRHPPSAPLFYAHRHGSCNPGRGLRCCVLCDQAGHPARSLLVDAASRRIMGRLRLNAPRMRLASTALADMPTVPDRIETLDASLNPHAAWPSIRRSRRASTESVASLVCPRHPDSKRYRGHPRSTPSRRWGVPASVSRPPGS
jgi:hypothetical protein